MMELTVMMMGGRRCGKTSVLAAMKDCFEDKMLRSGLDIVSNDYATLDALEKKSREARDYFTERNKKRRTFNPDQNPTLDFAEYSFNINLNGKNGELVVKFIDFPGEKLKDDPEKLQSLISGSRILIVAIDTPHLMEEDQLYDDRRNLERRVTEIVKKSGFASRDNGPGMILFVPLKCERYHNDGRMSEVAAQVKRSYDKLIQYASENKNITMAITPIFTLGGAAFSHFERDGNGDIICDVNQTPARPVYYFPDMNKDAPDPKYCEQPLLYTLYFVLTQAYSRKANKSWLFSLFGSIWDSLFSNPTLDDYMGKMTDIASQIKAVGDGYYIYP